MTSRRTGRHKPLIEERCGEELLAPAQPQLVISNSALQRALTAGAQPGLEQVLSLAGGNNAIYRLMSSPHDRSEVEAEQIARQVVAMPDSTTPGLHTRGGSGNLPSGVREYFEPRLGVDLGDVTVRTGPDADAMSRQLDARAFTTGHDVYFREGEYRPETGAGRELLAHELVHVAHHGSGLHRAPAADTTNAVDATALHSAFLRDRDIFLNLWLTAALAALEGAQEPKDEESAANFWVALAGNLLWAASTLVAPEALLIIRIMSFAGAAIGSGTLTHWADNPDQPPPGKEIASEVLTKSRDLMVQTSGAHINDAIADCQTARITDPDQQRRVLWGKLLSTSFNESEPIRKDMKAKIEKGMKDFLKQWKTWKDEIRSEAEDKGFTGGLPPDVYGDPDLVAKYKKDPEHAWMLVQDPVSRVGALELALRRTHPFHAEMKFE